MNAYKIIVNEGNAMLETRTKKKKVVFTLFNQLTKQLVTRTRVFNFSENVTSEINEFKEDLKRAKYKILEVEKSTIIAKTQYPLDELIECYNEHKFDGDPFIEELDEIADDEGEKDGE